MNKIYLLSPWVKKEYAEYESSLEYIKFYLIDSGYQAKIINCAEYDRDLNEVIRILKEDKRPIIGITAYTRERFQAYELIKKSKREIQDSLIVAGGRHFGSLANETLRELPEVDIVVRGEGEVTFKEICDSVFNNTSYDSILGISYKCGEKIVHNPDRPLEKDIDKFRNYDIHNIEKYVHLEYTKSDKKHLYFRVFTARGCPYSCVYCSLSARRISFRSVDSVIEEIEAKINATGARNVLFSDSSMTVNKKYLISLCEKILEKNLNIRWHCYSRVNIDTNLLKLMKKAGMVSAAIGLESGSPEVLKSIKKRINLEQVENYCKEAYNLGIRLYLFCMISLPDERLEDVDMTIKFVNKISKYIYSAGLQPTRIMPDAALYNVAIERKVLPKDFSWFKPYINNDKYFEEISHSVYKTLPIYTEQLTTKDIKEKMEEFNAVVHREFVYFNTTIRTVLRNNFRKEELKKLTFKIFMRKMINAFKLFMKAYNNKKKEAYFN